MSCFTWEEEVVVEVKVNFICTTGALQGNGKFDFPLGLPLHCWPQAEPHACEQLLYQGYFHLPSRTP